MTVDSTFLIFAIILAFGFVILGHVLRIRVFNLFSVAVFTFLGATLSEHTALLIACIGVSLYEIYYTFFSEVK